MVDPMSSTIFGPVFGMGASTRPFKTLDTVLRAQAALLTRRAGKIIMGLVDYAMYNSIGRRYSSA